MKKKLFALFITAFLICLTLCAFTVDTTSSLKSLTKPYINTYECSYALLGNENLLDKYEYIRIELKDEEELEVSFKREGGKKHVYQGNYTHDDKTGEINAEIGILGFKFRQASIIKNGQFTLCMTLLGKPLVMQFKA